MPVSIKNIVAVVLGVLVRACSKGADGEPAFKQISFGLGCGTKIGVRARSGLTASLLAACPDYSKESLMKIEQRKDEKHIPPFQFRQVQRPLGRRPFTKCSTHSYLPRPELHLPVAVCDATSQAVIKAAKLCQLSLLYLVLRAVSMFRG